MGFIYGLFRWIDHPLPATEGVVALEPLINTVDVFTDEYGVPHVFAENEKDLFFTAGYIAARDRLFQLSMVALAVKGELASVLGEKYVKTDIYLRTWRIHDTAKKLVENMRPKNRVVFKAFCEGINYRINEIRGDPPVEFKILNMEAPLWDPTIVAGYARMMAHEMSSSWQPEIVFGAVQSFFGNEKLNELIPDEKVDLPTIAHNKIDKRFFDEVINNEFSLRDFFGEKLSDIGSNSWVVSGKKTNTGEPMLANDPHLAFTQPPRWYEIRLKGGRFNVSGVCIAGIPMPVIGQNKNVAWGFTNTMVDDLDFFVESINGVDKKKYKKGDRWKDIVEKKERISIKGRRDTVITVRLTDNGPIISDIHPLLKNSETAISMSWTGHWTTKELDAWVSLTTMADWDGFTRGVRDFGVPGQNIVYADIKGNIGWRPAVYVPIRKKGYSMVPRPGHDTTYAWKGRVPFEKMPYLYNPEKGYISTANNRTIDKSFPYYISGLWADPSRAERIESFLDSSNIITMEKMKALQTDYFSELAKDIVPHITKLDRGFKLDGHKRAMQFIKEWDCVEHKNSEAAYIFHSFLYSLTKNIFKDELDLIGDSYFDIFLNLKYITNRNLRLVLDNNHSTWIDNINTTKKIETIDDILIQSFYDAYDLIVELSGPNWSNWKWGNVHTLTHKHALGDVSILNYLLGLNIGPFKSGGSDGTLNAGGYSRTTPFIQTSGASMRRIVDFSNLNETQMILPTGQSGLPNSPHYKDQVEKYNSGLYRTTWFDEDYIRSNNNFKHMVYSPK